MAELKSAKLDKACAALGVTIDHADAGALKRSMTNPGAYEAEIVLDAPTRKRFVATETHSLVHNCFLKPGWTPADATAARKGVIATALHDLAHGLIDCDPATCEADCWETGDDAVNVDF